MTLVFCLENILKLGCYILIPHRANKATRKALRERYSEPLTLRRLDTKQISRSSFFLGNIRTYLSLEKVLKYTYESINERIFRPHAKNVL